MKIWLITLPLLFSVGGAMAGDISSEAPAEKEAMAAPGAGPVPERMARHGARRLPGGDIRHCLDLKTNAAIIRCSETRRKR